ncbi:MAG: ABC transporter substrate-binding protein [Anaerolineae bacterium]
MKHTDTAQRLTVCTLEPEAASPFVTSPSGSDLLALFLEEAVERVAYGWEARLIERVPSLESGDVMTRLVPLTSGMRYADALGLIHQATSAEAAQLPQLVVTFTLKSDLLWSDGTPITAKDALLGYHLAQLPEAQGRWRELAERTAQFIVVNDRTLRWEGIPGYLSSAYPGFLFPLQPAHRWQGHTLASIANDRTPPATGPFRIVAWEAGHEVRLEPNRNYSGSAPLLEQITFRFPVTTPDSWSELLADDTCDVVLPYPVAQTAWQPWARLAAAGGATMWADVAPTVLRLEFNPLPVPAPTEDPATVVASPLLDLQVRQALAACVSRQHLAQALPAEALAPADGFVPPNHPAYKETTTLSFNPQAGGRLLDSLGWRDRDGDGVRQAEDVPGFVDGEPLSFTLHFVPPYFAIAAHVAGDLESCGADIALQPMDPRQLYSASTASPLFGGWFELALLGWQATVPEICGGWLSDRIPTAENGWQGENFSRFASADYDAACTRALSAIDPGVQASALAEAQVALNEELPTLFLAWRPYWFVSRPNVQGFRPDASAYSALWNSEALLISEDVSQD